ncbi:MAG: thioredoxin family protein [Chloroherpetonaceae bacterium]|nr:thioredoxin family protein [Chloroherpetonaceae bacterium]MDW8018676.1 thioredoxin family protein [Chloroherpetonaceae bacterium]MDW8466281.1 thioredoxin family protein [Chloroherpetonaceae bacterium]
MKNLSILKWTLAVLLIAGGTAFKFFEPKAIEVGKPAPNFKLMDYQGKMHQLSDFKGKVVVLEWYNPECPFVVGHYKTGNMQKLQQTYTEKGVVWLLINSSAPGKQGHLTKETAPGVLKENNVKATNLLFDHDGTVGRLYEAKTTPHMYIIDKDGILVYNGAIDDDVSTKGGANAKVNYVAKALDELLAGKPVTTATTKPYGCSVKYADKVQ